jgi:hypothetical protein
MRMLLDPLEDVDGGKGGIGKRKRCAAALSVEHALSVLCSPSDLMVFFDIE